MTLNLDTLVGALPQYVSVLPNAGVSTAPPSFRFDIRQLPWTSRLAADYAFDVARLAPFYAGHVQDANAWRDVIARVTAHPRPRQAVVAALAAQQARHGAPPAAREAAARLSDPRAVVIATGQQAGLFGGPLFTLLKALSALKLAAEVTAVHGVPATAVFWVDAEDHDWAEVNDCGVLDVEAQLQRVSMACEPPPTGRPMGQVALGPSIEDALAQLERALPPTDFTAPLLADLRRAYAPGRGMADAFATWLESLLGPRGLVVYDSSDAATKPAVASLFALELKHPGRTAELAATAGRGLEAAGYHAQVTPQPGSAALFFLDGGREPIKQNTTGGYQVGNATHAVEVLAARAGEHPEQFSPNVLLRPLVQDTLFPTVCYVGGPSELAYFAQLRGVYEAFGVPMPLLQPRASATLVDSNAGRFINRGDVAFASLRAQDESALNALLAAALPPSVDAAVEAVTRAIEQGMSQLAAEAAAIDATLDGATKSALGRMQDDVRKLQAKILQAAKRKDETLRRQFKHAQAQAFPGGAPQERTVGATTFLNRYGPSLVDRLAEALTLEPGIHTVLTP